MVKTVNRVTKGQGLMTQMVKIFVVLDKNGKMITRAGNVHPIEQQMNLNKGDSRRNWV